MRPFCMRKRRQNPGFAYTLSDTDWYQVLSRETWARRNGGQPGVDGESFADVDSRCGERWLRKVSRSLRDRTYRSQPERQVQIPKRQVGRFRPAGVPFTRDRAAQSSAILVHGPIFELGLCPEQYGYGPERRALDGSSAPSASATQDATRM